jgi:hypothetical protein
MENTNNLFLIRVGNNDEILETVKIPSKNSINEFASTGIGCKNFIVEAIHIEDRTKVKSSEIAEETVRFLIEMIATRPHTNSPQCLPVAKYRKLVEYVSQFIEAATYEKVQEKVKENGNT